MVFLKGVMENSFQENVSDTAIPHHYTPLLHRS